MKKKLTDPVKSSIVGLELKIHRGSIFVYVRRRRGDKFDWKVYLHPSPATVRRIAALAEQIVHPAVSGVAHPAVSGVVSQQREQE